MDRRPGLQREVLASLALVMGLATLVLVGLIVVHHERTLRATLGPALLVGIGTVAAPFLLMQPGMGAGIAASRTRRPGAARMQSLVTHTIFGLGLSAFIINTLPNVPGIGPMVRGFPNFGLQWGVSSLGFTIALILGFAAGFMPALGAYRSRIVDMLRQA